VPAGSGRAIGHIASATSSSIVARDAFPIRPFPDPKRAAGVVRGRRYGLDRCDNRGWPGQSRRRAGDATMSSPRVLLPLHTRPKVSELLFDQSESIVALLTNPSLSSRNWASLFFCFVYIFSYAYIS